ncbi:hypothetical protein ACF0H5_004202 [Mactra antiquata]
MKLDLEVLASTPIKRKKPWPKIIWIGEEQESLLLLDELGKRISVLYVPSGKTKRKLNKVSPLVEQVKFFSWTKNGRYLLGLLQNGELFIWHKEKDIIKFVVGLDTLVDNFSTEMCYIDASDDCSFIFFAAGRSSFLLWSIEKGENILREKGDVILKGSWHRIKIPEGLDLPSSENRECCCSSVFYESNTLGHCYQYSLVYNKETMISIVTLVLKFADDSLDSFRKSLPLFNAEWTLLEYPFQQMNTDFVPVYTEGSYVSSYSRSGQVLAVVANQKSPDKTTLLFVSPLTDTVLVNGLKNCGVSSVDKIGRQYWVADLAWTSDNLFLACILKNGSVCLVPRLGDPVAIQTNGCSVNMGPAYYLPLHPAVFVSSNGGNLEPTAMEQDPIQQKFSLATHPSLPIVLFSDGFLVTVIQLPVEMSNVTVMRDLVLESAKSLKKIYQQENLDMTVADAYKLSKGQKGSRHSLNEQNRQKKAYEFELAEVSLNATHESDVSILDTAGFDQFGAIGNMDAGNIVFGEPEMITIDPNTTLSGLEASESLLKYLEQSMTALTQVWKLAASYSDIWTSDVDAITKKAVHNFSKIFEVVLDCPAVDAIIPVLTPRQSSAVQNPRVYNIIVAYRNILQLLRFDTYNQHLIPAALRLVHKTITLMLTSKELEASDPRLKTLYGCFSLLKHAETSLNRVYVWISSQSQTGTPKDDPGSPGRFEPAVMTKVTVNENTDSDCVNIENKGQLPGKRLAGTWKLLYQLTTEYHSRILETGDQAGEISQVDKLLHAIQQILHDSDSTITPRSAAAKLSTVWLRHVFPFGLMSNIDKYIHITKDTMSSVDPKSSPSTTTTTSPFMSTTSTSNISDNSSKLKHLDLVNENYTKIISHSSSPSLTSGQNLDDSSPCSKGPELSPKVTEMSTGSSYESGVAKDSNYSPKGQFRIFNRIKNAVTKPLKPSSSSSGSSSTIHIGEMSSSTQTNQSSNSSLMEGLKSRFKSKSPRGEDKCVKDNRSTDSTSVPVIAIDILENEVVSNNDINLPDIKNSIDPDFPKSEGFVDPDFPKSEGFVSPDFPKSEGSIGPDFPKSEGFVDPDFLKSEGSIGPDFPKSEGFDLIDSHELESTINTDATVVLNDKRKKRKTNILISDKLSVHGEHTLAVEAWKEQLKMLSTKRDSPRTAKMLHAVLYTYILSDNLSEAVDFIDNLILQASIDTAMNTQELPSYDDGSHLPLMTLVTHRSQDSEEEELVPCIKNKSIRQVVQTMARFMATYFSNQTMYIYPPHNAQALPSVHMSQVPTKVRIHPKYHEDITNVIKKDELSNVWTTERTVEYLLLSGLICETAWFAHKMGDWKTAYLLSVAHTSHYMIAGHLYKKPKKPLQLPDSLSPFNILQEKLTILITSNKADSKTSNKQHGRYFIPINQETNIKQLTQTIGDMLLSGIVSDIEIVPWFLSSLIDKLKTVVSGLSSSVPADFYLPAPPLYCPQPGEDIMEREDPTVQYEKELRLEISSIIQLILVAFNAANLSLPSARWYIQELFKVQEKAAQFKATTEGPCLELPEILQQYKILRSDLQDYQESNNVCIIMKCFRDFTSILWLLHVRDILSEKLRKRGRHLSTDNTDGQSPESTLGQEYVQDCFKILKWAVNMLVFSDYLADNDWIRKVILSLILELPATEDTADILAEHFYMAENCHPEVQEKLERLLASWQSIEILPEDDGKSARVDDNDDVGKSADNDDDDDDVDGDGSVRKSVTFYGASPRAKSLSFYYYKQCEVVQKVLKKKRKSYGHYEEFVFSLSADPDGTADQSGSNMKQCIGSRPFETKQSYLEFLDRFYAICFTKVVEKDSEAGRKSSYPMLMPFAKTIREVELQTFLTTYEDTYQKRSSSVVMSSPRAKFYRSQSEYHVTDESKNTPGRGRSLFRSNSSVDVQRGQTGMSRYDSESSVLNKNSPGGSRSGMPSPSRTKPNMTVMASRFFKSEDVLYRETNDGVDAHWILNVNFGQRYLALQHLLDYLQHWASKHHSLNLHGKEIGLKPTMRITVPTQLAVLGLWLLENKYSSSKVSRQAVHEATQEGMVNAVVEPSQHAIQRQKALATVEELTERDSFTQVSNMPRSRSHSPAAQRSRSHSPKVEASRSMSAGFNMSRDRTLDYVKSITSTQEETELKTAYKKILDEGDESSSLEVSSLEPDDYSGDLKHTLSALGSGRVSRNRHRKRHKQSPRRVESSPESRNNSALNNTMPFVGSPERTNRQIPQTSTPLRNNSPANRGGNIDVDISHISLPPTGNIQQHQAKHRSGIHGTVQGGEEANINQQQQGQSGVNVDLAGMNIAEQLQHIVRGELRRMMEVQHASMMAMMGALDGQPVNRQDMIPQAIHEPSTVRKGSMKGVLGELKNLQINEEHEGKKRRSRSPHGKENIDSPLRMSQLQHGRETVEVYRVTNDDQQSGMNFYPNFLRIPAEKDEGVRFPHISQPREAWGQQQQGSEFRPGVTNMPLLHVDRTVPAHKCPASQRPMSLPNQQFGPGFFQPPPSHGLVHLPPNQPSSGRSVESPDSGIGFPLLKIPNEEDERQRKPRYGELLPPDVIYETSREKYQHEQLKERYLQEYHQLQSEKSKQEYKQRFGENLLRLNLGSMLDNETQVSPRKTPRKTPSPRKTPTPRSPRKTPRSISEVSSKRSKKKVIISESETSPDGENKVELSEKQPIREDDLEEEAESEDDDDRTEAESMVEEEETEEDNDEELHDGYAIKHGEFEAYLALENALAKTKDTNARIQLKTALRLQRQRMMENWKRPKVDFATNTAEMIDGGQDADFVEPLPTYTSEKATSITKDTGVDPIQEAVIEYNHTKQGHLLPPDIYMGLRFNEGQQKDGRTYLNVVDLDASAILNDLRERVEPDQHDQSITPQQQYIRSRIGEEEVTRHMYEPPVIDRPTRADELTLKVFETKMAGGEDRMTMAILPRDSMPDSKYAIMSRLRDMNSQLAAIDHMSNNIEREFKNTRLAINTLEEMNNAMAAEQDVDDKHVRMSEDVQKSRDMVTSPQPSSKSPTPSMRTARSTSRSKKSTTDKRELSVELAKLSGLSGISDIIGDMVAKGDIDLNDVGLSKTEAERLVNRGIIRREEVDEVKVSLDEIKKLSDTVNKDNVVNKEELHSWMINKRQQQMAEYKKHLEELREREVKPFKPKHSLDQSSMREHKARQESRKASKQANMSKRLDEAQNLLGNILTDKPQLPAHQVTTPKQKTIRHKDRSPVSVRRRTPMKAASPVVKKPAGILKTRDVSPPQPVSRYHDDYMADDLLADDWLRQSDDRMLNDDWLRESEIEAPKQQQPKQIIVEPFDETRQIKMKPPLVDVNKGKKSGGLVPRLRLHGSLDDVDEEPVKLQQTGETTGELTEYYKAMEEMDVSSSHDYTRDKYQPVDRDTEREAEREAEPPKKSYKPTPYTKIVKVQRPEVTRKKVNKFASVYNQQQGRLSISESARTTYRSEMTDRERQMIYGSKRLPRKKPTETTPRRVKTYTERLQDMKTGQKYSTPVAPKSHLGSSIASTSARPTSRPVKPKHKPMTYVEQLQKLNEGHHKPKAGTSTQTIQRPLLKSHKPAHKSKTYAEQLQELQPHKTYKVPSRQRVHKTVTSRQRPYKDPYTQNDGQDNLSVVSGWSMDDNVRHLLYDDVESSIAVGQSASYAPSEQMSDYYDVVMGNGDDYTASVDIDDLVQIADGGSVSSGSMMSFIDWDQVDDLIADVR